MKLTLRQSTHLNFARQGEALAGQYLQSQGFRLLEKNFKCSIGEIDIIAQKQGRLYFVEVKTRRHHGLGRPEEAVNFHKQRKIIRVAQWYLKSKKLWDVPMSFSVIAITYEAGPQPNIRFIEDAFGG